MRICLITGEYPPDEGGVADYTACLAAALVEQGMMVDILTRRWGRAAAAPPVTGRGGEAPGRLTVYRAIRTWSFGSLRKIGRVVDLTAPNIVHLQYQAAAYQMQPAIHFAPLWLRLTRQARLAVTYHDLRVPYLFPKAGPLRRAALRQLARHADLTLATNSEDYSELAVHRFPGRVEIVPIGSNIPDAPPQDFDRAAWRAAAGIAPGSMLLAYFGFLNASKGGGGLVEALRILRAGGDEPRLVMIGGAVGASDPTNADTLAQFRSALHLLDLEDAVIWTGHVEPEQVSAWLHAADVVTLPYVDGASYRRGSLLAALAHGRPVVTTTPAPLTGGILPALVDGEALLLVPPGDPAALANAVGAIAEDPALAARLSTGARAVAAHFTWPAIAARHIALYRAVLAETEALGDG
jgi:glycosyltransferase involved in cell wall biosynthesis